MGERKIESKAKKARASESEATDRKLIAPEITPAEKAELFDAIEEAEEARRRAKRLLERAKDAQKLAKETYMAAAEQVNKLAGARQEELPLFVQQVAGNDAPATPSETPRSVDDEAWRRQHISEAKFSKGQIAQLARDGIGTLGALAEAIDEGPFWWKTRKIDQKMAGRIENHFRKYREEIGAKG